MRVQLNARISGDELGLLRLLGALHHRGWTLSRFAATPHQELLAELQCEAELHRAGPEAQDPGVAERLARQLARLREVREVRIQSKTHASSD